MTFVRRHGIKLSAYDFGRTTVYASQLDPRFSYCAYVPEGYDESGTDSYRLMVTVHGTLRDIQTYRDAFIPFAEQHRTIVLAPLFPSGVTAPGDLSSYKMMVPSEVRYDLVLLSMIDEMKARYRIGGDRFALFGFSGGAHFAHRFYYLHPERVAAVSIAAPGTVTLLDFEHDFWIGVRDFEAVMGRPIDLAAMRSTQVQMVIGADDTETWEIAIPPSSPNWRPGVDLAGTDRQQRMRALKSSFENHGIAVRHDIVPGVGHTSYGIFPAVQAFLADATAAWPIA
jgi:pimeloyl-ACP methyl ester carboxylesterase